MSLAFKTLIQKRALMLRKVRAFFDKRSCFEVDTSLLSKKACIDAHIDLFEVYLSNSEIGFLHSSPEYAMKKLLSKGSGDIYQLSHVYRKGEKGRLHHPIFTMVEWYRINTSYEVFIQEAHELITLFLGSLKRETLTYKEAFFNYLKINPFNTSTEELLTIAKKKEITISSKDSTELLLNQLWACCIEPHLGQGNLTVITNYPASQSALARIKQVGGEKVAERFEIYFKGIELGNGYHELKNSYELKKRLEKANQERLSLGKDALPLDDSFLEATEKLPECYGMAIGFDRLMMLKDDYNTIDEKGLPFSHV